MDDLKLPIQNFILITLLLSNISYFDLGIVSTMSVFFTEAFSSLHFKSDYFITLYKVIYNFSFYNRIYSGAKQKMVVDDSMLIRHTVCRFLEEKGFIVEAATDGAEALEIVKTVLPDIIITDLNMPKMNGSELITRLKEMAQTAKIPIVVISARQNPSRPPSEETRADYVIYKDIELVAQLSKALATAFGEGMLKD